MLRGGLLRIGLSEFSKGDSVESGQFNFAFFLSKRDEAIWDEPAKESAASGYEQQMRLGRLLRQRSIPTVDANASGFLQRFRG